MFWATLGFVIFLLFWSLHGVVGGGRYCILVGFGLSWCGTGGYELIWQFCFFSFLPLVARDLGCLPVTVRGGRIGRALRFRVLHVYGWEAQVWSLGGGDCGRPRQFPPAAAHLKFTQVVELCTVYLQQTSGVNDITMPTKVSWYIGL